MHTKSHKTNLIIAISVLIIPAVIYNICKIPLTTHAEEEQLTGSQSVSVTASPDRNLSIDISSANVGLDFTPNSAGVFKSSATPLTVTVSTNNPTGYNLNMTTTTTNLTRTASLSGQTPVIATLSSSGSFTADTFETNAWGFSLDGTNYQAVAPSRQINQTIKESNNSATNITFGVKLNNEIPSGDYKATLTFIATTNPLEANFDTAFDAAGKTQVSYNGNNYYKMQDMSGFICSMVATPTDTTSAESTQLIDTRDFKIYYVAKLLDDNCWMNTNLDLTGGIALYSSTSDVPAGFEHDPYYTLPASSSSGFNKTGVDDGYVFNSGKTADDCANGCYSYYSWNAATAMSGTDLTEQDTDAPYSICPKGWKLPTSRRELSSARSGSDFYKMAIHYGLDPSLVNENPEQDPTFCELAANCANAQVPRFIRAGGFTSPTIGGVGTYGPLWSATLYNSTRAEDMDFNNTYYYSSNNQLKSAGVPVRCLARTDLTIEDATYLQDVTPEMRQNTRVGTTTTLKDKRDNEEYTIGKLADGNIWLLDNLRLNLVTANLTADDTNAPADAISLLKNGGTTSVAGYTTTAVSYVSSINSSQLGSPSISTEFINDSDGNDRKYGVYYNFCATSAGTYCYGEVDAGGGKYDICPAGWRLPTMKTDNDESKNLYDLYSNYNEWFNALRLPYSGFVDYNGEQGLNGQLGYFVSPDLFRENLEMTTNKTKYGQNYVSFLNGDGSRIILYSVRCLLK